MSWFTYTMRNLFRKKAYDLPGLPAEPVGDSPALEPADGYEYETPYGIEVTKLVVTRFPRTVAVEFAYKGDPCWIQFADPNPLLCDDRMLCCEQIRIVDRNRAGMQLEFGRYQVQLWGEDGPFAEFSADSFEVNGDETEPTE